MPIDKSAIKVGLRVQDLAGEVGVIRWYGELRINGVNGHFCGVEFDVPKLITSARTDGKNGTTRVFSVSKPGTGEFIKPKFLSFEIITKVISELKSEYPDFSEERLMKFCVARKCDKKLVKEMIAKNIAWVEKTKPAIFTDLPAEELAAAYPVGWHGHDKEGNLLHIERPGNGGKITPSATVEKFGIETLCRWHIATMELMQVKLREAGAKRCTFIIDLTHLGSSGGKVMDYAKLIAAIDQDNYPESVARFFIINAPMLFSAVWAIVKNFVDENTRQKIFIFGTSGYRDTMLKFIDEKFLPHCAGGKCDDWITTAGGVIAPPAMTHSIEAPVEDEQGADDDDEGGVLAPILPDGGATPMDADGSPSSPGTPAQKME
eukprot:PhM_4_TR4137/c0_g1_i1/m.69913